MSKYCIRNLAERLKKSMKNTSQGIQYSSVSRIKAYNVAPEEKLVPTIAEFTDSFL
jgi:hypothetical protein